MLLRLTLAFLITTTGAYAQSAAIGFDTSHPWTSVTGPGVFGWDFTVNSPIRLTAVGIYDNPNLVEGGVPGDGIVASHAIGIWRSLASGAPILSTILPAGAQQLANGFRYVPIAGGLELQAGNQYVIGALYDGGNNEIMVDTINNPTLGVVINPAIALGSRRWINGATLQFPSDSSASAQIFGANFLFEPIPEPSAWALLISSAGLIAIAGIAKKRNPSPSEHFYTSNPEA